jgi:hypothetical protein
MAATTRKAKVYPREAWDPTIYGFSSFTSRTFGRPLHKHPVDFLARREHSSEQNETKSSQISSRIDIVSQGSRLLAICGPDLLESFV